MRKPHFAQVSLALALASCAGPSHFVWVEQLPEGGVASGTNYVIASGELLSVRVYNQEGMSARVRVRSDGKISLPFVDDVQAAGLSPTELAEHLRTQLRDYIAHPVVTVSLEESRGASVSVVGEVNHPGNYPLEPGAPVLSALAAAGGLTDFASHDCIFVVRNPAGPRIRFRYQDLIRSVGKAATFRLQSGDVVVAE